MVGPLGVKPRLFRLSVGCFNQLSYEPVKVVGPAGVDPVASRSSLDWRQIYSLMTRTVPIAVRGSRTLIRCLEDTGPAVERLPREWWTQEMLEISSVRGASSVLCLLSYWPMVDARARVKRAWSCFAGSRLVVHPTRENGGPTRGRTEA